MPDGRLQRARENYEAPPTRAAVVIGGPGAPWNTIEADSEACTHPRAIYDPAIDGWVCPCGDVDLRC